MAFARTLMRSALATLSVAATVSLAAPASAQTLQEELLRLVQENPQILAGRDQVGQAGAAVRQAAAGNLPSVTLNADNTYRNIDGPNQRADDNIWSRAGQRASVNVTQNLYDAGRTSASRRIATLNQSASEMDLRNTRQQVLLQGVNAYVEVVRQARLVDLARKNERIIADRTNLEDERVQRGGGTAVDVLLAKTRLQLAKERRVVLEGALRDAISRYTQVFGHPPDPTKMIDPALPLYLVPADVDAAVVESFDRNPVLAGSAFQVSAARTQQEVARADYYPSLEATAGYNWERNREGTLGTRRDYTLGVQGTWNIFNGFATRAAVTDAAFGYSAALNNQAQVARRIEEEVRLSWTAVNTGCDRRLLLDNAVSIAAEVHDARVRLRDAGRETIINVLDAESELFNSEINLIGAMYDEKLALYRLAIAMGRDLLIEDIDAARDDQAGRQSAYEARCASADVAGAAVNQPLPRPADPNAAPNPFRAPEPAAAPNGAAPANPFLTPAPPANPFLTPANPAAPGGGAMLEAPAGGRVTTAARTAPFVLTPTELAGFAAPVSVARRQP